MPLIVLGIVVIVGLCAYLYFSGNSPEEADTPAPKQKKQEPKEPEPAKVIELPTDIEKEKRRRNIKTDK